VTRAKQVSVRGAAASAILGIASLAAFAPACGSDVECGEGEACNDRFDLTIIPGGRGFEIGTYHFDIITKDETFAVDCYITGSADATGCDPMVPLDSTAERPSFEIVRDDAGVVSEFAVGFDSAPKPVQVRVLFGNEVLADETYESYEPVRIDASCPTLCEVLDETVTVLP
jgi:hypothetical protein